MLLLLLLLILVVTMGNHHLLSLLMMLLVVGVMLVRSSLLLASSAVFQLEVFAEQAQCVALRTVCSYSITNIICSLVGQEVSAAVCSGCRATAGPIHQHLWLL